MAFTIEDMQKTVITARGQSARGNPTDDLQSPLTWESTDATVVGIVDLGGLQVEASAQGPLGSSTIRATGDNSAGIAITGELVIDVKAGPTVAILLEAAPAVQI